MADSGPGETSRKPCSVALVVGQCYLNAVLEAPWPRYSPQYSVISRGLGIKTRMPIPTSGVRLWSDLKQTAAGILHFCSLICASRPLVCNPSIVVVGCLDPAQECSVAVLCKRREPILCGESGSESARESGQFVPG